MADGAPNEFTTIITDEAERRGIEVELLDPATGDMVLRLGDQTVRTIQSLSELTSAIAYLDCDDKLRTRRVLTRAGIPVPPGREWLGTDEDRAFVRTHGSVVVKPARGEGGAGITVGVGEDAVDEAVVVARDECPRVLVEARCPGDDLRVLVIDGAVVAAAVRRPPAVRGDGESTLRELVDDLDRRRSEASDGAARVPPDETTAAHLRRQDRSLDDVLDDGEEVAVRGTANVHTGGSIDDVTDRLHPAIADTALRAARAIGAPVLGVDVMAPDAGDPDHVVIEVNEQPGLANHGGQPTAARFVDLLFPETA